MIGRNSKSGSDINSVNSFTEDVFNKVSFDIDLMEVVDAPADIHLERIFSKVKNKINVAC